MAFRRCSACGSNRTYHNKKGEAHWYKTGKGKGFLCSKCRIRRINEERRAKRKDNYSLLNPRGQVSIFVNL